MLEVYIRSNGYGKQNLTHNNQVTRNSGLFVTLLVTFYRINYVIIKKTLQLVIYKYVFLLYNKDKRIL